MAVCVGLMKTQWHLPFFLLLFAWTAFADAGLALALRLSLGELVCALAGEAMDDITALAR